MKTLAYVKIEEFKKSGLWNRALSLVWNYLVKLAVLLMIPLFLSLMPSCSSLPETGIDIEKVFMGEMTIEQLIEESGFSGGLVVYAGSGTGDEIALIAGKGNYIVQGLEDDQKQLSKARQYARTLDLDGRLTFKRWTGDYLPYTDFLVNVLFWSEKAGEYDLDEIIRVLAPRGIAYIQEEDGWSRLVRPWPDGMDEWPHYRYDAGSTGASKDKLVGPPNHIQWEAGPRFMRSHEVETGLGGMVSSNGRIYYILDEGPLGITDSRFPPNWSLICRDGFNGIKLWKRPLPSWGWQTWRDEPRDNVPGDWWGVRGGIGDVDRLLVAGGDTLFVVLEFGTCISAIDGPTGEVMMTYEETAGAAEFIYVNGLLIVRTTDPQPAITAIRAVDGKIVWQKEAEFIVDRSLCAVGNKVFFHNRSEVVSLDLRKGDVLWRQETHVRPAALIAQEDVLLVVLSAVTMAFSNESGELLWEGAGAGSRGRWPDMFVDYNFVWSGRPEYEARHIQTGELLNKLDMKMVLESGHHRRCYTDRATASYIITGERGSEFISLRDNDHSRHNWFRGPCISGMVPANGLFYVPPHPCFCYPAVRMDGFFALSTQHERSRLLTWKNAKRRLEKGPAYGKVPDYSDNETSQWPTYRQNGKRSGSVSTEVSDDLERLWSKKLGGNLTQPVVAGGMVLVVQKDAGTLHCIDFNNGRLLWSKTVAGRIDSPPSLSSGHVIFGSRDGFVYSLRATDGEMAWRFRAAPDDRQIVSYDRLESAWPAHGSVLIMDGLVYCSAGRSGFLDGGIYLYALDLMTGELVHETKLEGPYPDINQPSYAFHKDGHRSDLLSTDGTYIYMGRTVVDTALEIVEAERVPLIGTYRGDQLEIRIMPGMRLIPTGGFLNDTFWNRTWWMYSYFWPGYHYAQQASKSGQMLVFDDHNTYTVKHYTTRNVHSPMFFPGNGYLLFADDNDNEPLFFRGKGRPVPIEWEPELSVEPRVGIFSIYQDAAMDKGVGFTRSSPALWTSWIDVRIESMALAGDKLFFAGTPDIVPEEDPLAALEGRMGGILRAVSTVDGSTLTEYPLESGPVFDGLIAVKERLLLSTRDGQIICMGKE